MFFFLTKNNCSDIIETLNPLAPLVALPTHVEHVKIDAFDVETRLENSLSQHTAPQQILIGRRVIGQFYHFLKVFFNLKKAKLIFLKIKTISFDLIEEVLGAVNELILVRPLVTILHAAIGPKLLEMLIERVVVIGRRGEAQCSGQDVLAGGLVAPVG